MKLTGPQRQQLIDALIDAFPYEADLERMVSVGLNKNLYALAGGRKYSDVVFSLIRWAESQGFLKNLIVAARDASPENSFLSTMTADLQENQDLEEIVIKSVHFANVEPWIERLKHCLHSICKVEISVGIARGTGFLLGPTVLITNYHVMQDVLLALQLSTNVVLRFDYRVGPDGRHLQAGIEYALATNTNWLISSSPVQDLDYALLRISDEQEKNGHTSAPISQKRPWLTPRRYIFAPGEALFIIQHPQGMPLQIASGAVAEVLPDQRRVYYTTNTLQGSSGSPCFASDGSLVALHRSNDRDHARNTGIPFTAILADLQAKNLLSLLGDQQL